MKKVAVDDIGFAIYQVDFKQVTCVPYGAAFIRPDWQAE
ncbi:Uncharacterised protein [Salmonella enterica subsp. enterica serovar Typhimurium]|nr:Uncharacterised protein [Salmonella enterica subsp. enterica serovar Typhimurium]